MLHEIYAPRTVDDIAWSRQKSVALAAAIRQARGDRSSADATAAGEPPRALLLYGPPGCGKLESLKVLLQADTQQLTASPGPTAAAGATASTLPVPSHSTTVFHVFHTCESTVPAYAQYLQSVLSFCRGQPIGGELSTAPHTGDSVDRGTRRAGGPHVAASAPPPQTLQHAHIIKCYGEPASHALHRCTLQFLREFEELRACARRAQEQQRVWGDGAAGLDAAAMRHVRRNLIFLLHTTHDTHNDRLDLSTTFPSALLQSPAVELFHCTPLTEINLRKRLRTIVEAEASRRRRAVAGGVADGVASDLPAPPSPPPPPSRAAMARARRTTMGRRRPASAAQTTTSAAAAAAAAGDDLLDPAALTAIAAGSQGDIRQALLQVQWSCLVPTSGSPVTKAQRRCGELEESAAAIWARLEQRRAATREAVSSTNVHPSSAVELSSLGETEVTPPAPCLSASASSAAGRGGATSLPQSAERVVGEPDEDSLEEVSSVSSNDVVIVDSPSSSSQSRSSPRPQASRHGSNSAAREVDRNGSAAASPTVSMSLLLTSVMESASACASVEGRRAREVARRPPCGASGAATPSDSVAAQEQRSVLPTTRDEYIGLSHAVGRLLTQKYSIDAVLDILNVPPRKILDYLTNNQIRYFSDDQLSRYACCADAASAADALRASEWGGSSAGAPSAAAVRGRRQLADRTTAGENRGSTAQLLEVVGLHLHHLTYRVSQREVRPPPGFVAQEPPPYLRSAYPRLRDTWQSTGERRDAGDAVTSVSEREWVQVALARLASVSGSGTASGGARRRRQGSGAGGGDATLLATPRIQTDEVDVLREGLPDLLYRCGSTEAVVLDDYALAPSIVLALDPPAPPPPRPPLPSSSSSSSPNGRVSAYAVLAASRHAAAPARGATAPVGIAARAEVESVAPRRTVFRFESSSSSTAPVSCAAAVASAPMPRAAPPLRFCTPLQLAVLRRGCRDAASPLRSGVFAVATGDGSGGGADTSGTTPGTAAERPLIPDGEDIDENFDDE
ncbi:hypothetical protein NESM_000341100 [Novymonas esmeraldas]|uniref:AAA+ ATPase domain-containing protein n=1 Tax=Novymonas esmeraldas TaxID=1808958 RepID=A0AAW0EM77_9TRYP